MRFCHLFYCIFHISFEGVYYFTEEVVGGGGGGGGGGGSEGGSRFVRTFPSLLKREEFSHT